jgi:ubiquinone biosynthesis protein Coq4
MDNRIGAPSAEEERLYKIFTSEDGKYFLEWLRKETIEKPINLGVQDGVQTAMLQSRELGKHDIYHKIIRLIIKITAFYDARK